MKRFFATVAAKTPTKEAIPKYRVLVLGGGASGISVISQLNKFRFTDYTKNLVSKAKDDDLPEMHYDAPIGLCEPSSVHYYQPLWTLVGAGLKTLEESKRPEIDLLQDQIKSNNLHWLQHSVTRVHPEQNIVELDSGLKVRYDYLVVATGLECQFEKIPGIKEALDDEDSLVCSNYSADYVQKTARSIEKFKGGTALFTQPSTPIKCAGAPQKIMYLAEEAWKLRLLRDPRDLKSNVVFKQGMGKIFAVDKYAKALTEICEKRNIQVDLGQDLKEIDPLNKKAVFVKSLPGEDKGKVVDVVNYNFLHFTPSMAPPKFIKESGLGNDAGFCLVDNKSLQHPKHKNVFSIGDSASLPVSKTASAIASQIKVLVDNLAEQVKADTNVSDFVPGSSQTSKLSEYDGYTACPLVTGRGKLIMAEFNGFTLQPNETFWFDQSKESSLMYTVKSDVLPHVYWNRMLKGEWDGPAGMRKYFNPKGKQ